MPAYPPRPTIAPPTPDAGLAWTGFSLAWVFCIPLLPLIGVVLGAITLWRHRFPRRWVAVTALAVGVGATGLQVLSVAAVDWGEFSEGFQEGMQDAADREAEDARRNGRPTEIAPTSLRPGDCFDDPNLTGVEYDETVTTTSVTLVPCRRRHDLEVFAVIRMPDGSYPGQDAIDRRSAGCFPRFRKFNGRPYADSGLEVYFYGPSERSWRLLGDHKITCVLTAPGHKTKGSLRNARR